MNPKVIDIVYVHIHVYLYTLQCALLYIYTYETEALDSTAAFALWKYSIRGPDFYIVRREV